MWWGRPVAAASGPRTVPPGPPRAHGGDQRRAAHPAAARVGRWPTRPTAARPAPPRAGGHEQPARASTTTDEVRLRTEQEDVVRPGSCSNTTGRRTGRPGAHARGPRRRPRSTTRPGRPHLPSPPGCRQHRVDQQRREQRRQNQADAACQVRARRPSRPVREGPHHPSQAERDEPRPRRLQQQADEAGRPGRGGEDVGGGKPR